jgi:hypothetical protein
MSDQSEAVFPAASSTVWPSDALPSVRQLACAWAGLWVVAAEDLGNFYQRCVARGEQILQAKPPSPQPEVKPSALEVVVTEPRKPTAKVIRPMSVFNAFGAVESYHIDLNAEGLLPTKRELDVLSERVEVLAREVDTLTKQREP